MTDDIKSEGQGEDAELGELLDNLEAVAGGETSPATALQEQQANESLESYEEVLGLTLGMGLTILAPNWGVTEKEVKELSNAYAAILDKYFPGSIKNFGPEISALLITGVFLAPRIGKPRVLVEEKPETEGASEDD